LCGKSLTEREGKSIGLAFFLVVAIKTNLSTNDAAKVQKKTERGMVTFSFFDSLMIKSSYHDFLCLHIVAVDQSQHVHTGFEGEN